MRRGTKAIIKSFFNFRKGAGAKASTGAFVSCIVFILVLLCVASSFLLWFFPYYLWSDEVYGVVIVNAPDSFKEYNRKHPWYSDFIYKKNDAAYDFVTYYGWMDDNDAFLTVVFPDDFDKKIEDRLLEGKTDQIEVLTYYATNSIEYTGMKDRFINEYLKEYQQLIRRDYELSAVGTTDVRISDDVIPDPNEDFGLASVFAGVAKTIIPLLIFIAVLFAAMSSGTNVIAGQKEQGTFTEILMSPLPRASIIIGNTAGVTVKALIPASLIVLMTQTTRYYMSPGILAVILYVISLALLVSSIVILVSVISDNVISAQTTFLPIFLILIAVCVTCVQNYRDASEVFLYFPIYGHFYGIGIALIGDTDIPGLISCVLSSALLSAGIAAISSHLLHKERFTVSVESVSKSELQLDGMPHKVTFMERADRITANIGFYADQVFYPLAVLSVFQLLAVIPTVINYMSRPEYTDFIMDLKNVVTLEDIMLKTFEVFGIFLSDPLFLGLMLPGYILIILTYIIRVYRRENVRPIASCFSKIGLPLTDRNKTIKSYLTGLVSGLLMMGTVYVILLLTGQIGLEGIGPEGGGIAVFFINLLMWLPQGMSEELMFRGFMIPRIRERSNTAVAVIVSSLLFSAFHSLNIGFTPLAAVNLFLIALLFALIYLKTGNIWMTSAIHTMWNLTQGNLLGLQVSGTKASASILQTFYYKSEMPIITGGDFGPEGGLAVTAVTVFCLILLLLSFLQRRHPKQKHETESA